MKTFRKSELSRFASQAIERAAHYATQGNAAQAEKELAWAERFKAELESRA